MDINYTACSESKCPLPIYNNNACICHTENKPEDNSEVLNIFFIDFAKYLTKVIFESLEQHRSEQDHYLFKCTPDNLYKELTETKEPNEILEFRAGPHILHSF